MISRLFPKWKSPAWSCWKTRLTRKSNNKASITFTVMSQILWNYVSSGKHGFIWRGDGSPWALSRSIQIILELRRKNYSATAFSVGKQVVREALAIFFPYQPDELGQLFPSQQHRKTCYSSISICSFPGETQPWAASYHQDNYMSLCMISLYIFGINTVMVRRLPNDRLARRYRP